MNPQRSHWDERYAASEYVFGTEPNDFLRDHAHLLPLGRVVCIGDGEGRNGVHLAGLGYEVTSVDLSAVGLAKAHALAARRDLTLTTVLADLADWAAGPSSDGPWSGVVSVFCHLPPEVRAVVYPALVQALAPGGVLLLESYTPDQVGRGTGGPPNPELLLDADRARAELAGLELVHVAELEREVHEGRLHHGAAAVLQVIGRKPGGSPRSR